MRYQRRDFIKLSSHIAAGVSLMPLTRKLLLDNDMAEGSKKLKTYGIQLYSLRADLPKDPKGILKQVASLGYKQIESFEGDNGMGMFWGMSNTEFKKYMDDLGMTIISSHCDIDKDFEKKAANAAEIGMKYLVCGSRNSGKTIDDFKKVGDDLNQRAEICRKNGIGFAYHNHEVEFKEIEGQFIQDIIMTNTDPTLVDFEMDVYWVVTGKQDPETWLNKYPNRFRLGHVKDRSKNATVRMATCTLGEGSIDFPAILKAARKAGMKYFIVEQDECTTMTQIKCAEANAEYMKKLKI